MTLSFRQTIKSEKRFKGISIENSIPGLNFYETHQMKMYPNILKIRSIDGAGNHTKMDNLDIIPNILVDKCSLQKLHII